MYNSYYEKILTTGEVKCIDDEIPFEIPESWKWERWGNISQSIQYGYNAPALKSGDIRMVRISDIQNGKVLWESVPYCNIQESEIESYLLLEDDILFARTGGTVGKSFIVTETPYPAIFAGYLIRTRYSKLLYAKYMKFFMESELYWSQLREGTIATAQPNCNGKTLGKMLLPIPPYLEQTRIVRKIEQITTVLNKYQEASDKLNSLDSCLNEDLKKSILQYAIQGKLVPQIDTEEPATILLEKIHAEKLQLLKEGKLKKKDIQDSVIFKDDDNRYYEKVGNEMVCIDDELPFDIPQTWTWINIGALFYIQTGASFKKEQANSMSKGVRILRGGNISPDYYSFKDDDIFIDESLVASSILLRKNDLITPAVTSLENVGKMARVLEDYDDVSAGGFVFILRPNLNNEVHSQYLCAAIQSPYLTNKIKSITKKSGSAFYNIGKERLVKLYLPLPPLAEQSRIVNALNSVLKSIEG